MNTHSSPLGQTGLGAVFIQSRHGEPAVSRQGLTGLHGNPRVGVAGIPNHQHLGRPRSHFRQDFPLLNKDFPVQAKKFRTLHAGFPRNTPDAKGPIRAFKCLGRLAGGHNPIQKRKGPIPEFHDHPLKGILGLGHLKELQTDLLVRPEQTPRGNTENQGIADLSGRSCDSHPHRCGHGFLMASVLRIGLLASPGTGRLVG